MKTALMQVIARWRVWLRYRRAKHMLAICKKTYKTDKAAWKAERTRLVNFYEKQLATERKQFQLLHTEWANRFLQSQKLMSLSIATANLEDAVKPHLLSEFENAKQSEAPENLTPDQYTYFEEIQKAFWEDGVREGKSEIEIQAYWDKKEAEIMRQVRQEILPNGQSDNIAG